LLKEECIETCNGLPYKVIPYKGSPLSLNTHTQFASLPLLQLDCPDTEDREAALTHVSLSDAPWLNRRRPGSLYSNIEYE
jgi:hypothetical protein